MQITDALNVKNKESGIKSVEGSKLCSTHNLVSPNDAITSDIIIEGAKKLIPIDPVEVVELLPKDYFKLTKEENDFKNKEVK